MASIARHHAEWLSLIDISGPFLSIPVLMTAFPQGLDAPDPDLARDLRAAHEEWLDNQSGLRPDPAIHTAWVQYVFSRVLELDSRVLVSGQAIPEGIKASIPEHAEVLRPDYMVIEPGTGKPRLLLQVYPAGQKLTSAPSHSRWVASAATRMMELLHATEIRLGLITNGEDWMLVDAPRGETTGYSTWNAALWSDEPITLQAFRSLLGRSRFFNVPDDQTLAALLAASSKDQQEVTDQLGEQVLRAVEILIQSIDRADQDRGRVLLADLGVSELYEAALTVMMRLVFLLSAEERGLLLLGDPVYDQNYAASTLRAHLRELADRYTEEVLERRYDAWPRLLALFRAVYGGIDHENLRLLAYGGSLFDPDRFPFLEGRLSGTSWKSTPAQPLPINNRTVLHLLEALQILQVRGPGGTEARRLSFRALDIEQIGHVYEGLLDHQAVRADQPVLGLAGTREKEPELPLAELEARLTKGRDAFLDGLKEATGRSLSALRRALDAPPPDMVRAGRLRAACGNDDALYDRVLPFAGLVRDDDYGTPMIVPAGSVYVTAGATRRSTGTHYTPRSLTEPIVQHTLEPLIYVGPAEGQPRADWTLKPAADLLNLKICDMAMGSGAFLVQACRYLSERLVEAWEMLQPLTPAHPTPVPTPPNSGRGDNPPVRGDTFDLRITPEGKRATGDPAETIIPRDREERLIFARRLVADRCLYGVDKNPLAVEMAKLSLWLVTLDKGRPFTFLDHALKCGDSLVGVSLEQLRHWNLDTETTSQAVFAERIRADIDRVIALRREIAEHPVNTPADQARKALLHTKAEAILHDLRGGADMLIGSYFNDLSRDEQEELRFALLQAFQNGKDVPDWAARAADLGALKPFHWHLEFPEVFLDTRGGFSGFVGNPPFIGGKRIRDTLGDMQKTALYNLYPKAGGNADYCAYFFLRAFDHLGNNSTFGLIATNTIAQGDTREAGLDQIVSTGGTIYHAVNNQPWPGQAAVVVSVVHIHRGNYHGQPCLDGVQVESITPLLDASTSFGKPIALVSNEELSFIGSFVNGMGFVLEPEQAEALLKTDFRNRDVIFPYLNGEDLNSRPDQSPSRWVINFFDWSLEQAQQYLEPFSIVQEKVYPVRAQVNRDAHRKYWWHYGDKRPALYSSVRTLRRILVKTRVTRIHAFAFFAPSIVFSDATVVVASESSGMFATLQSSQHEAWAWKYASTMKQDLRYSPSDVLETFPFPHSMRSLETIGEDYYETRRQIMLERWEGLTATYNRFHNSSETSADIAHLRALHVEMDQAVAAAYGWSDLDLGHGFHTTAQGVRYTISEAARRDVLARLLHLNHERYAEEVRLGLHDKKGSKGKKKQPLTPNPSPTQAGRGEDAPEQLDLFDDGSPKQKRLF